MRRTLQLFLLAAPFLAAPLAAQDANFIYSMADIEAKMHASEFRVLSVAGSRAANDRTQRVTLQYPDSAVMIVKWGNAEPGGDSFNNAPRYEQAAYELQKLIFPPEEYVVPPTTMRVFPLLEAQAVDNRARPTFDGANSVLVLLQYWMSAVTNEDFWDKDRFEADTVYARYFANMNILTHLIDHRDANTGNFLISIVEQRPRVFSVDNGVAFRSERSNRGTEWGRLRIDRLPHATVEHLRAITPERLTDALATLAEWQIQGGELVPVEHGPNLRDNRGVREEEGRVQIGLTKAEINDIAKRLEDLLKKVDEGKIDVF